jgi:hypothetical protein
MDIEHWRRRRRWQASLRLGRLLGTVRGPRERCTLEVEKDKEVSAIRNRSKTHSDPGSIVGRTDEAHLASWTLLGKLARLEKQVLLRTEGRKGRSIGREQLS